MLSRRQLVIRLAACSSASVLSAFPWKLELGSLTIAQGAQSARAQGKGAGNGNGNGGGNGGGNGNGNGSGKGRGNGGGNGGKGKGKGNGNGQTNGKSTGPAPAANAPESPNAPSVDVRHEDGIQEAIRNGRYVMRDRQGRVIIDRRATIKDRFRLHSFLN
ncbi:hypothetical protein KEU06_02990 [Pseudaminobacter sp. 19-2017]|uniref:Uncharacterized protein n=1 Tax=Pseudaminobacter soli (ex Zhang et al. 2022) TaxID=2831468 RepID=A0A942DYA6_9HYPH|nr:hypothetical protein [Pseudaminobacter soli]MBS3647591.1 hypothetical protein [Pseudaminobacter soli]